MGNCLIEIAHWKPSLSCVGGSLDLQYLSSVGLFCSCLDPLNSYCLYYNQECIDVFDVWNVVVIVRAVRSAWYTEQKLGSLPE